MPAGIERVKVVLELPEPVYRFLEKAVRGDVQRFLQHEFEVSLRSLFDYYGWSSRFRGISSLLKEYLEDLEFNPRFEPISEEKIEQRIREALRSRMG